MTTCNDSRFTAATHDESAESKDASTEVRSNETPSGVIALVNFDELYQRHFDFVWRSLSRFGVHASQIDDAVQDTFLVMHRRLGDLRSEASPKAFCFAIAMRVAQSYRRSARRRGAVMSADMNDLADLNRSPFDEVAHTEAERVLQEFLVELDSDRRAVFLMAELGEMTAPEISRELQMNLSTVYTRLRAARLLFAEYISARGEPPAAR